MQPQNKIEKLEKELAELKAQQQAPQQQPQQPPQPQYQQPPPPPQPQYQQPPLPQFPQYQPPYDYGAQMAYQQQTPQVQEVLEPPKAANRFTGHVTKKICAMEVLQRLMWARFAAMTAMASPFLVAIGAVFNAQVMYLMVALGVGAGVFFFYKFSMDLQRLKKEYGV